MLFRLLLLFTVLPLTELALLIWIEDQTSLTVTICLVLLTGVVGATLARWQGWRTVERIRAEMAQGRMPADSLLDGMLILLAGTVLITPGILTDVVGFSLLVPGFRRRVKRWLGKRFRNRFSFHTTTFDAQAEPIRPAAADASNSQAHDRIIDARVIDSGSVRHESE